MASGRGSVLDGAGVQEEQNVRLCILKKTANTIPFQLGSILARVATAAAGVRPERALFARRERMGNSRGPVELVVRANISVAGIVDDEKMIGASML